MKTIPLAQAFQLLSDAAGVILPDDGHAILYPSVNLENHPDNAFCILKWDDEGQEFDVSAFEKDNETVTVVGTSMFLNVRSHDDGELNALQLRLLKGWAIEEAVADRVPCPISG